VILTINHALAQLRKKKRTRPQRLGSERHCRTAVYNQWTRATHTHTHTHTYVYTYTEHTLSCEIRNSKKCTVIGKSKWVFLMKKKGGGGVSSVDGSGCVRITSWAYSWKFLDSPTVAGEWPKRESTARKRKRVIADFLLSRSWPATFRSRAFHIRIWFCSIAGPVMLKSVVSD